eukprot:CAMPEP_0184494038 /NCGR_PEP_ID=MMETSP0113_2-20130426/27661_1 /TAXON_ID=91329 /ORGANISM="Norrisiella sphaerica, Strain BC52" /LENGTH=343 /DNA_ID=CAMNT_0026879593 /DNA_START=186 /DNA_END=1217 /DNA_ORIENTATION=+
MNREINDIKASKKLEEGNKYMSTSMFRWKPDYFKAAQAFEEAGRLYKENKDPAGYTRAQRSLGQAYYQEGRILRGAQELCNAAAFATQNKYDAKQIATLYEQAADWFIEKGSVDRGARTLLSAAKSLEKTDIGQASTLALKALSSYPIVEKGRVQCKEVYSTVLGFLLRNKKYSEADECIKLMLKHWAVDPNEYDRYIYKAWTGRMVISMFQKNLTKTVKILNDAFDNVTAFGETPWGKHVRKIIAALGSGKTDMFNELMKGDEFRSLDNQVARIARKVEFDEKVSIPTEEFKSLDEKVIKICGELEIDEEGRVVAVSNVPAPKPVTTDELDLTGDVDELDLT